MRKLLIISFMAVLSLIAVAMVYAQTAEQADALFNEGKKLYENYQYKEAIERFEKAAEIDKKLGMSRKSNLGNDYGWIGYCYKMLAEYDKAIENYKKALAIDEELGVKGDIAIDLNNIGGVYYSWGQYDKAIENYKKALAIDEELGAKGNIAISLNNIGMVYYSWGQYDKAIEYYKKALAINEELGKKDQIAIQLNNIGSVYDSWGQYDKAIEYYKKALAVFEEFGQKGSIATLLNNIGMVYYSWGQYDKAIEYYKKALAIAEKLGQKDYIAGCLNNIGLVYDSWGQYDKAIEYYKKALAINEELGRKDGIAINLGSIGRVYYSWGQYDKAIEYYKKALAIAEKLGQKDYIAGCLNDIGLVYNAWGQYDKAIEYYKKALAVFEEFGQKGSIAGCLNNIGAGYWDLKEYKKAEEYLNKSVSIKEELRLTAEGEIRRDYLASQICTYQWLISTYLRDNKPDLAFNTIELSSAKYLSEQIGEKLDEKNLRFTGIKNYQDKLPDQTAIISYANINLPESIQIVVDKNSIYGKEVADKQFIENVNKKYKDMIIKEISKLRGGVKSVKKEDKLEKIEKTEDEIDKIINYYRLLLTNPKPDKEEKEAVEYISRELYKFLFGCIESKIQDKTELVIIPNGILAFLPFETLIMPDGKFLIEKYHIRYTQSLTVSEMIAKRRYSESRKMLLGFGGAVYDEISYKSDMVESGKQLENLKKETFIALNRGSSTRDAYSSLGLGSWANLPGTLTEVKAIKEIIKDSEIWAGENVDESKIKKLSKEGKLKNYKILHLATHGLVVPEIPELSAIVLSLFKQEKNNEDGYLTMKEIAGLDINADFINLSACETGLGKIYGGEGVVGLTQSFLVAGANGLSVSLWSVADESTMKFMIGLYKLVQEKGISYDKAITEMKREFIKGEVGEGKYSHPFYWAPFIYYGR